MLQNSKVVIIHGCSFDKKKAQDPKRRTHDRHWYPWLKKILENKGIKVYFPKMPTPWQPNYQEYRKTIEKIPIDKNTILIGASCGASFLVRWLGDSKQKIKKLILVSPYKNINSSRNKAVEKLVDFEVNSEIKYNIKDGTVIFTSDEELTVQSKTETVNLYRKKLDAKIISIKGYGHYTMGDMGKREFPEILKELNN
jgi:predicted alpha/beta hydrolase family esterase